MQARKIIPALWLRIVVVVAFGIYMAFAGPLWIALIAAILIILTSVQLVSAYRQKEFQEQLPPENAQ